MSELFYTSDMGSIFLQPNGPGTPLFWLGVHDLDSIDAPEGEIEISMRRGADRKYRVAGQKKGMPEPVTTTVTGLTGRTRDWLEKVRCSGSAALYVMQFNCARMDNPTAYDRAKIMHHLNISTRTFAGLATREGAEDATHAVELQGWPPLLEAVPVVIDRLATTETLALNAIWADRDGVCPGDCGDPSDPGDVVAIGADGGAGSANVLLSTDGNTFAAAAADPFGVGLHVGSVVAFPINKTDRRWLVGKIAVGAAQGLVAFSDNGGVSWTSVSIGGAAAGHGVTYGRGLFASQKGFVLLAGAAGYIYKSIDGGQTWTAVDAGLVTAGAYSAVHFADEKYGAAVAAAGVVAVSQDGGETWSAASVINGGAAGNLTVHVFNDRRIMVGDDAGRLWQSNDFGSTWNQITGWTGSGSGDVRDIDFTNDFTGFMAWNSAAPVGTILRTVDGGANWVALDDVPTNTGLNSVFAVDENTAYAVGEATGGTGVILKVQEA